VSKPLQALPRKDLLKKGRGSRNNHSYFLLPAEFFEKNSQFSLRMWEGREENESVPLPLHL
jgi:hypothetical protein